jgi:hypothetical protein
MKYTKGPWICDIRVGCIAVYAGEKKNCLSGVEKSCILYKHGKLNNNKWTISKEDEANARLISAAPDLYEACKAFEQAFEQAWQLSDDHADLVKNLIDNGVIKQTKQALLKAEGK